jgi:type III secretion system YscD/HrpQ family protein
MSALPQPRPAWCLRFLSGALKGRTIALKPGANAIGSGSGCEVMLPGGEVQPRHLVMTVGELVISVQKVGGATARLNGEELGAARRSVLPGDILAVGAIELELDRSYADNEADDPMFAWSESMLSDDAPEPGREAQRASGPAWRGSAAAVLVAMAGLAAVAVWSGSRPPLPAAQGPDLAALEKSLLRYPEVQAVAAPGGQMVLKGFVESKLRRQELEQAVQPFGDRVLVQVLSADDVVEQARRYIANPGIALTYAGKGQLIVSGTAEDDGARQKIRRLGEDLHPNVLVSDRVQYRPPKPKDTTADAAAQWSSWQSLLPARLVSITEDGSGLRYLQLANGTRYYEGAVLRSGAELTAIDIDRLTVQGGGARTP